MDDLIQLRRRARLLLDLSAPRDGLAAYYALYHDPARTRLLVEVEGQGAEGFLAVCQTGRDLFRLLAVLRARHAGAAAALLRRGLLPHRPYYLVTTPDLQPAAEKVLEVEKIEINRVYRLDLARYAPTINVLVVPTPAADGSPRFVIRSQGEIAAEAGVNWQSPHFAEVYVWTARRARGRGWGKAVVESCVAWVVRSGVQPLYIVSEGNAPSIRLAESVGFVDTGAREFAIEGIARGRA
jgi:GNAT superfamily N-acetyltransferase